jgi:hypothetical protein
VVRGDGSIDMWLGTLTFSAAQGVDGAGAAKTCILKTEYGLIREWRVTPTKLLATKYFSESAAVYMLKTEYFEPSYLSVGNRYAVLKSFGVKCYLT